MAEIKRLNYFTGEFLVEEDFIAEQAYHMRMRRHHNRMFHGFGVIDGLEVIPDGDRAVRVTAGTALDAQGREIVLVADVDYSFEGTFPLYLAIAYDEVHDDPADRSPQTGVNNFIRWTERPRLQESRTPPTDESAIVLALVQPGSVDTSMVPRAAVKLAPGNVGIGALAITAASGDMPGTLAGNAESANPFTLVVDSPSPQFLLASVTPTTLNGVVSFSYTVTRGPSSGDNTVIYKLKVKNLTSTSVDFNVNMQTLALA
jgi:hypothetical protein